jgi:antitoxin component YwqK of YwqJK toxin-antitoxin module
MKPTFTAQKTKLCLCLLLWAGLAAVFIQPGRPPHLSLVRELPKSALEVRDGKFCHIGTTNLFTGFVLEHYDTGALQSRSMVRDGLLDGVSEGWRQDGKLQVREYFLAGVSHGERAKWHANGVTASRAPIDHGKIHGVFRRWHENGILAESIPMVNGHAEGVAVAYYPSGCVKSKVTMHADKAVSRQLFADQDSTRTLASQSPIHP